MEEIYHIYQKYEGKDVVAIYVNYPAEYEFSLDFDSFKKNVKSITTKIREYALKNLGNVSNQTALLVLNGVVIGTILLTTLNGKIQSKEVNKLVSDNKEIAVVNQEENKLEEQTYTKEFISNEAKEEKSGQNQNFSPPAQYNVNNSGNYKAPINTPNNNSQPTYSHPVQNEQSNTNTQPVINEKMVNVRLNSGQVVSISLEEYIVGVVGAEMPASFNIEALKAQAVAARTYALKRGASSGTLSATTSDQVYKTESELRGMWGSGFNTYYNKVKDAVYATKGQYMTYNGNYIDALYFSTSNGKTEDASYVWGTSYPYIKSVDSSVDKNVKSFSYTKTFSLGDFNSKLGVNATQNSDIQILSRTSGDRVNEIKICNKVFTGVKVRTLLGLRSADFDITINSQNVTITTRGYGHGCGMSQYGANELAKQGYSYTQILHHYYQSIQIGQ